MLAPEVGLQAVEPWDALVHVHGTASDAVLHCVCLFPCLSVCPVSGLPAYALLSIHLSVHLPACLSVCLCAYPDIHLSVCLHVCLYVCVRIKKFHSSLATGVAG